MNTGGLLTEIVSPAACRVAPMRFFPECQHVVLGGVSAPGVSSTSMCAMHLHVGTPEAIRRNFLAD
jgi:hypothetical protein